MKVLKSIGFVLMHGFIVVAAAAGAFCLGLFGLATPIMELMMAAGYNPWLTTSVATLCVVGPLALMFQLSPRYFDWLEELEARRAPE